MEWHKAPLATLPGFLQMHSLGIPDPQLALENYSNSTEGRQQNDKRVREAEAEDVCIDIQHPDGSYHSLNNKGSGDLRAVKQRKNSSV